MKKSLLVFSFGIACFSISLVGCSKKPAPGAETSQPAGAQVEKASSESDAVAMLARVRGLDTNAIPKPVVSVDLNHSKVADDDLKAFEGSATLKELKLRQTNITDKGLAHLRECRNLEWLHLQQTKITDAGLEQLKGLSNLRRLELGSTGIDGSGLRYLKGLTNLAVLDLQSTNVNDAALQYLKALPALRTVNLPATKCTPTGAADLRKARPELEVRY